MNILSLYSAVFATLAMIPGLIIFGVVNIFSTFFSPPQVFYSPYFQDQVVFDAYKENLSDLKPNHFLDVVTGEPAGVKPLFWRGHTFYYEDQNNNTIGYNVDTKQKVVVNSQVQQPSITSKPTTVQIIDESGTEFLGSGMMSNISIQTSSRVIQLDAKACVRDKPLISDDGKYIAVNVLASESDNFCQGGTTNLHILQITSP